MYYKAHNVKINNKVCKKKVLYQTSNDGNGRLVGLFLKQTKFLRLYCIDEKNNKRMHLCTNDQYWYFNIHAQIVSNQVSSN